MNISLLCTNRLGNKTFSIVRASGYSHIVQFQKNKDRFICYFHQKDTSKGTRCHCIAEVRAVLPTMIRVVEDA